MSSWISDEVKAVYTSFGIYYETKMRCVEKIERIILLIIYGLNTMPPSESCSMVGKFNFKIISFRIAWRLPASLPSTSQLNVDSSSTPRRWEQEPKSVRKSSCVRIADKGTARKMWGHLLSAGLLPYFLHWLHVSEYIFLSSWKHRFRPWVSVLPDSRCDWILPGRRSSTSWLLATARHFDFSLQSFWDKTQ